MLKLGLIAPSARRNQPTTDEQAHTLVGYGVAAGNIHQSGDELLAEARLSTEPVEVVVGSLAGWGRNLTGLGVWLRSLEGIEASITILAPQRLTLSKSDWFAVIENIVDLRLEGIAERKQDAAAAARSREIPVGPTPKLSQADVDWVWERREQDNWGPDRIVSGLKRDRNIAVSKWTVLRVLGLRKGAKPYVPRDNHKFLKRDAERRA
ncbi:hypothetical protein [Microbacterium sp. SORGH_AS_0421]|uniref:hypothetical protein n=1 Tax=Microbacterium sp. SORGH_AS_0421 TaxID=3041768 RepID=UPI002793DF31|nr:hypothetical protein [Microbacterium sp. SORGH_AS_0421]MDQ1175413.1 hypothetical protein [Microbacterium sp. SORGH_AS_0421]